MTILLVSLFIATLLGFAVQRPKGFVAQYPVSARFMGLVEIALALAIVTGRRRRVAITAASAIVLFGSAYVVVTVYMKDLPDCGCWGGWVQLGPWIHLGLNGALLFGLGHLANRFRSVGELE